MKSELPSGYPDEVALSVQGPPVPAAVNSTTTLPDESTVYRLASPVAHDVGKAAIDTSVPIAGIGFNVTFTLGAPADESSGEPVMGRPLNASLGVGKKVMLQSGE